MVMLTVIKQKSKFVFLNETEYIFLFNTEIPISLCNIKISTTIKSTISLNTEHNI